VKRQLFRDGAPRRDYKQQKATYSATSHKESEEDRRQGKNASIGGDRYQIFCEKKEHLRDLQEDPCSHLEKQQKTIRVEKVFMRLTGIHHNSHHQNRISRKPYQKKCLLKAGFPKGRSKVKRPPGRPIKADERTARNQKAGRTARGW